MYQRMYREGKVAAARLEASLVEARLSALRGQLQPHFLFNTLNAIAVLTGEDPARAHRMLLRLGDLLRLSIDDNGRHEVSLSQELATLACYLDIQQVRFEERLRVALEVEESVREAAVPAFLLQPLVENAVRHGVDPNVAGGEITVRARSQGDRLTIEVQDNGRGLRPDAHPAPAGVGLGNTRARLAQLYGDRAGLSLEPTPTGGARVTVTIPLHRLA
jgi:LytS/YehU family sensor histidine kinase